LLAHFTGSAIHALWLRGVVEKRNLFLLTQCPPRREGWQDRRDLNPSTTDLESVRLRRRTVL
jgi:hypothetical protein